MVAVIAFVSAVPAPQQPRQIAPRPEPKNINPDAEQIEGSDDKDLKGSASYGYGYYGGPGYGGYGWPYSYSYGYPSYGFGYYGHCTYCVYKYDMLVII